MSHRHQLAPTTHTIELNQVQDINRRLAAPGQLDITAEAIGTTGTATAAPALFPSDLFGGEPAPPPVLRSTAVLCYLSTEGSPEFPYIIGHFAISSTAAHRVGEAVLVVELHSDVLRRLSVMLGLRHCWGTDAVQPGAIIR